MYARTRARDAQTTLLPSAPTCLLAQKASRCPAAPRRSLHSHRQPSKPSVEQRDAQLVANPRQAREQLMICELHAWQAQRCNISFWFSFSTIHAPACTHRAWLHGGREQQPARAVRTASCVSVWVRRASDCYLCWARATVVLSVWRVSELPLLLVRSFAPLCGRLRGRLHTSRLGRRRPLLAIHDTNRAHRNRVYTQLISR